MTLLAHTVRGHGPAKVLVLHDWLGDRRSWDPVLPYLDEERFTWAVADALPVLVLAGEHDQPWFSAEALRKEFAGYSKLEVATVGNAGHYPMQETPVALATLIERFLAR